MDLHEVQDATARFFNDVNAQFQRIPGSAIAVRYIKSSYQNDPVRSAIELFLFLFAVRYLLAPKYSTQKKVQLTDAVCFAGLVGKVLADRWNRRLMNWSRIGRLNRLLRRRLRMRNWTMRRGLLLLGMRVLRSLEKA
jgi:hypothetical protein